MPGPVAVRRGTRLLLSPQPRPLCPTPDPVRPLSRCLLSPQVGTDFV